MKLFKNRRDEGGTAVAEPTIAPAETLDQVQDELNTLQAERARLEDESRVLADRLAVIAAQTEEAKAEMASCAGGSGASALDALDRERVELQRRREGLQILIERLAARQAPLQAKARQFALLADQQRQDEAVAKFRETAENLSKQVIDGWVKACRDAYELVVIVDDAIHAGNLDDVHKSQVLGVNERLNELFIAEGLKPVNEAWPRRESHLFRRMAVVAARPK